MPETAEITKQILKKVRQVEIRSRRFVTDTMVGAYHSVFKGQGMDFEEVREYSPGDDALERENIVAVCMRQDSQR